MAHSYPPPCETCGARHFPQCADDLIASNRSFIERSQQNDAYERLRRRAREMSPCTSGGNRHLYQRDYVLGMFPIGRPYCLWCGDVLR